MKRPATKATNGEGGEADPLPHASTAPHGERRRGGQRVQGKEISGQQCSAEDGEGEGVADEDDDRYSVVRTGLVTDRGVGARLGGAG